MKLNTQALSQVTIGTPVLQPGPYFVKIRSAVIKAQKGPKTGQNLNLTLAIIEGSVTGYDQKTYKNNGEMAFFDTVSLAMTDIYDPNKRLKEISEAVGNVGDDLDSDTLVGKFVKVQVKYSPASTGKDGTPYNEKNIIGRYQLIVPADNFNTPIN